MIVAGAVTLRTSPGEVICEQCHVSTGLCLGLTQSRQSGSDSSLGSSEVRNCHIGEGSLHASDSSLIGSDGLVALCHVRLVLFALSQQLCNRSVSLGLGSDSVEGSNSVEIIVFGIELVIVVVECAFNVSIESGRNC